MLALQSDPLLDRQTLDARVTPANGLSGPESTPLEWSWPRPPVDPSLSRSIGGEKERRGRAGRGEREWENT